MYRLIRISKPDCKFSSYLRGIRVDFKFRKTVQDLGIKRRDLKVREGSTAIRQTSLVLEKTNSRVRLKLMSVLLKLLLVDASDK